MLRGYLVPAIVAALLSAGCVPVTEPVGDITKAKPDKELIGIWTAADESPKLTIKIDTVEVEGNPTGLMRMNLLESKANDEPVWFFVSTVGKEKYGNLCFDTQTDQGSPPDFGKKGAYEKWAKGKTRAYFVFRYTAGKDQITLNFGDEKTFKAVAEEAKLPMKAKGFETPAGWLEKYLDKNGHKTVFPASADKTLTRMKK